MSSPYLAERFTVDHSREFRQRKLSKEVLGKSYTPSLGPSKSTTKRLPARVVIGRIAVRSARLPMG